MKTKMRVTAALTALALAATVLVGHSLTAEAAPTDPPPTPDISVVEPAPQNELAPTSEVEAGSAYPYTVESYLDYVLNDVHEMWKGVFAQSNLQPPVTGKQIVLEEHGVVTSKCYSIVKDANGREYKDYTVMHNTNNAFYCGLDNGPNNEWTGTIYLPVNTMRNMWTGNILGKQSDKAAGDFGAALVAAHEYGHSIEHELATQKRWRNDFVPPNQELLADCFAGVWMTTTYYKGTLEPGDFEEGMAMMATLNPNVSHGTPEQRRDAVYLGYFGDGTNGPGNPDTCIRKYWVVPETTATPEPTSTWGQ